MAEAAISSTTLWTTIGSVAVAVVTAAGTFAGIWWKEHRERDEKEDDGRVNVQLARIANEATDRERLVTFLNESVKTLNAKITELENELDRQRRERDQERNRLQRRVLLLARRGALDSVRIGILTQAVQQAGLTVPPMPTLDDIQLDDPPEAPKLP